MHRTARPQRHEVIRGFPSARFRLGAALFCLLGAALACTAFGQDSGTEQPTGCRPVPLPSLAEPNADSLAVIHGGTQRAGMPAEATVLPIGQYSEVGYSMAADCLEFRTDPVCVPGAPAFEQEGHPGYLPEDFPKPRPFTHWQGFLDADPIPLYPGLNWPWDGNQITPALVMYGSYSVFAAAFQQGPDERIGIGHQMLIDVDLSLGATERIHAQWRPVGEKNSGGSFLQLNEDVKYFDNSTALPQRIWLEADISEIFSGLIPDTAVADILVTAGLFPYELHNRLLINDDIVGVIVSKNDLIIEPFSKILGQVFTAFDEVDAVPNEQDVRLVGTHWFIDWQSRNIEATYVHMEVHGDPGLTSDYYAVSLTQLLGPWNVAGRVLGQVGDDGRDGSGELYVLESNWTRYFTEEILGFESLLLYANAFWATEGWQPISGGNFDRLRNTFEVNPLIRLSLMPPGVENRGFALGTEFFALHKDLAVIPELAVEFPGNDEVVGFGARLRRKVGRRSQVELRGITSASGAANLRRHGAFLEWTSFF